MIITGEYNSSDFHSYPKTILAECEKERMSKVLVNALEVKGTNISTMDRFFLGEEISKTFGPKIKIAVAWPAQDINKFAETVALNRGAYIRVMGDINSAEKWLTSS